MPLSFDQILNYLAGHHLLVNGVTDTMSMTDGRTAPEVIVHEIQDNPYLRQMLLVFAWQKAKGPGREEDLTRCAECPHRGEPGLYTLEDIDGEVVEVVCDQECPEGQDRMVEL